MRKHHTQQQEESDCGVACLLTMLKYYGGNSTLEKIRALSGTTSKGTTLLGMFQAAEDLGFKAQGCKADIQALQEHQRPVILHLNLEHGLQHYIIAQAIPKSKKNQVSFLISDPAQGVYTLPAGELEKLWVSKKCLTLVPKTGFQTLKSQRKNKYLWLWKLIKEDVSILLVSLVLGIMIAVLGLVMAVFTQKLIDDILPSKSLESLILGIVLVTFLLIARVGLGAIRQYLLYRQNRDFNNRLMLDFFAKLLRLPKPFFDTRKIGDLTTRLHDTSRIQKVIRQLSNEALIDMLIIVISLSFLFAYNSNIAILSLFCLPFIFGVVYSFNRVILRSQRELMQSFALVESNYIDTIQGISDIKTFNKISYFHQKNQTKYAAFQDKLFFLGKLQVRIDLYSGIMNVMFIALILGTSSYFVYYNLIELGVLMAILSISSNILGSVLNLALIIIPLQEAKIAFDRIVELSPNDITSEEPQESTKTQIKQVRELKFHNIKYRFAGRRQLLKDVNIEAKKGEMVIINGYSGSGKSTLLQIMNGFYPPESGQFTLNDLDFNQIDIQNWHQKTAYIPQNIKVFNASLLENISLSQSEEEFHKVISFCKKHGFEAYFEALPQGYLTFLGENGVQLSGGQSQLLAIARALYHQPEVLLLDESTSAMDKQTEGFVIQLFRNLNKEMIIIWVSHKDEISGIGDKVYNLENGMSNLVEMADLA